VNLEEVRTAMAATIEEAKANDPKALRAEIARLRDEVAGINRGGAAEERDSLRDQLARHIEATESAAQELEALRLDAAKVSRLIGAVERAFEDYAGRPVALHVDRAEPSLARAPRIVVPPHEVTREFVTAFNAYRPPAKETKATTGLSKCARAILNVLAQRGVATDSQLSALSGYRVSSSTFANGLSELRVNGFMDGPPERRQVTASGRKANGPIEPLPRGSALLDYWGRRLGKCERAMLEAVYRAGTISRAKLSERTNYRETSSTFANGISSLRMLELIHGPNGGDLTIADVFTERAA
jgi:hypothetical protein